MKIKEKIKHLPEQPGCYLMKDQFDHVIYVGKAKNLKARVSSYFTGSHNLKTTKLVSEIASFDFVITNSEQESLILEINLIKQYRPKYNIVFMDDKTYPYIQITNTTPPEIKVVRTKNVKGKLFGPYPNVKSARSTARLLQLLFPMGRVEKIPNFYEEIGNKIEPNISNNYYYQVQKVIKFLKGDTKEILDHLNDAMNYYSSIMMFERAAVIRDQIEDIKTTTEKQLISLNDFKDRDIIGISYNEEDVSIQILFMRSGKIIDQHQTVFYYVGEPKEFVVSYLAQFYENHYPDEILFDKLFTYEDLKGLKNVFIPQKGDKRKIVELATKNAKIDLKNYATLYRNKYETTNNALVELKNILNLEKLNLIEAFDNSQLFGTAPISAMIVYENMRFNKKLYRKYHLKNVTNDDYGAMREVIYRRYQRVLVDKLPIPDLIIVDGGIGQVNAALESLEKLNLNIKVIGLQKDDNHKLNYIITDTEKINIKNNKLAFNLLFKISEEVHRYAISFHRQTRQKIANESPLDKVKGLGPKRKKILLSNYPNLKAILDATDEEIISLKIPEKVVKNIKEVLKDALDD